MAHFAELDENNKVLRVIVVDNKEILDENNIEQEQKGIDFCFNLLGGRWIQTSFNGNFRKNYAGVGFSYDKSTDFFIPPKPFDSWILGENFKWKAPVDKPQDGKLYIWNEETKAWIEFTPEQ